MVWSLLFSSPQNEISHEQQRNSRRVPANRGYLDYRKSVIEMGEEPALEWVGPGCYFEDILGRKFIDCCVGISPDEILDKVEDTLEA